jgi:TPR repeat protein
MGLQKRGVLHAVPIGSEHHALTSLAFSIDLRAMLRPSYALSRDGSFKLALFLGLACGVISCGPSKVDAQAYLESQGLTVLSMERSGKSFNFTATKGENLCTGIVSVQKGFGTSSQSASQECELDTRACKPGAPAECVKLADALYGKEATVFPTKAATLYRTACADKNGHACGRVAQFERIDKHFDQARSFAQQGCNLDDGDACYCLGISELDGEGTAKNEANALELFKNGCAKSNLSACRSAAGILLDREPSDFVSAMPFADKVCQLKFEDGCVVYGMALFRAKDYVPALPLFQQTCPDATMKTHGIACNFAGSIFVEGLGTKKDPARALDYFEKACAAEQDVACSNAGKMYKSGLGATPSKDKSDEYFAKACKLGATKYCTP